MLRRTWQWLVTALVALTLLPAASPAPAQEAAAPCGIAIDSPRNGQPAPRTIDVRGTATLPPGGHLWLFARRVDYDPEWWLQGEAKVDTNHQWHRFVTLGEGRDSGFEFNLTAAVFSTAEHDQLKRISISEMESGQFLPHEMPRVACPGPTLTVRRN